MSKVKTTRARFKQVNGQLLSLEADLDFDLRMLQSTKVSLGDDLRKLENVIASFSVASAFLEAGRKRIVTLRHQLGIEFYQ